MTSGPSGGRYVVDFDAFLKRGFREPEVASWWVVDPWRFCPTLESHVDLARDLRGDVMEGEG